MTSSTRDRHSHGPGLLPLVVIVGLLVGAVVARAASETDASVTGTTGEQAVQSLKARKLAEAGDCVTALPELAVARQSLPGDAGLALLEGQCRIRMHDYVGAVASLRAADALAPDLRDKDLYLAIALYHAEEIDAAMVHIERARARSSQSVQAELDLYHGLLLLARAEARDAALLLERARIADPAQVEPVASYYAALAWQSVNERENAREALERVRALDEGGPWAARAEAALAGAGLRERGWGKLRAGLEYDSNVVLRGDGVPLPQDISRDDDGRAAWFAELGAELLRTDRWAAGLIFDYSGSAHFTLNELDMHYPSATAWVDHTLGARDFVRASYTFGHAWVDYEDFLTAQGINLSLFHNWERAGDSELFVAWDWNDFHFDLVDVADNALGGGAGTACSAGGPVPGRPFCSPPGVMEVEERDRDGNGLRLGVNHRYPIRVLRDLGIHELAIHGGYHFGRYWAEGSDYDYDTHVLELGLDFALPWSLRLDVTGDVSFQEFESRSSFPNTTPMDDVQYGLQSEDRSDFAWQVDVLLERAICKNVVLSARYFYVENDSNLRSGLFDYERHVVGAHLTYSF